MQSFTDPETLWLDLTNLALGIVTLACLVIVGKSIVQEVYVRVRNRVLVHADDHAMLAPGLGLTMADGGEPIKKRGNVFNLRASKRAQTPDKGSDEDSPNIIRSDN